MKNRIHLTALVFFAAATLHAGESGPVRVLILDGFSNHDWARTTRLIRGVLDEAGGFSVSVATCPVPADSPAWLEWHPDFSRADVVIQNCNDFGNGNSWPGGVKRDFEKFVAGGGGLYAFHSANNAFVGWTEYEKMVGLLWRKRDSGSAVALDDSGAARVIPPGEGRGTGHGDRVNARVTRVGDHPAHAGLPRRWMAADIEIYTYARGPAENLTVLAYAFDKDTKQNWPVEWTTDYGKGRVYSSTYGHVWRDQADPLRFRCAGMRTLVPRVTRWLAKRPVDATVPKDFPTEAAVSLRQVKE